MKTREEIIIPLIKGKSVLDLGCSWGDFRDLLKRHAFNYRGVDIEEGADFKQDLNKPFNLNKKFDVIAAGELIEHIENMGIFFDNIKKHLKKQGLLFLTTPNPTSLRFFVYSLINKEPEFGGHVHYYTKDSLELQLKKYFKQFCVGYTINVTNNKDRGTLLWKLKFSIERIAGDLIKRFSPHLFAIARKK